MDKTPSQRHYAVLAQQCLETARGLELLSRYPGAPEAFERLCLEMFNHYDDDEHLDMNELYEEARYLTEVEGAYELLHHVPKYQAYYVFTAGGQSFVKKEV